jgi:hypothetical protein
MTGGRLLFALTFLLLIVAAVFAGDDSKSSSTQKSPSGPPKAEPKPIAEMFHGTRVIDNYRWLEDGQSPATEKWVAEEMAYTRALLDPLPGREAIHRRLTELLQIGSITPPQVAGRYYFYTRREGMQNQPVLYVREELREISPVTAESAAGDDFISDMAERSGPRGLKPVSFPDSGGAAETRAR